MDRDRLTITLRRDVLKKLDALIDGVDIRNRSHAIETLLIRALAPRLSQAVILAGGQGVKLRPLTYELPKALIPVGGKPILQYLIELLRSSDVRDIILATGHLGKKIRDHFGNGRTLGVEITYLEETKPLGTAGALKNAQKSLGSEQFLVLHGDILVDIDLAELIRFHQEQHVVGTIALTTTKEATSFGMVSLRGSKIVNYIEKPSQKETTSYLINSGIYIFEPEIFTYIDRAKGKLLEDIFPHLAHEGKLAGFPFEGRWLDVSTPKAYEEAIKVWSLRKKT